MARAAYDYAREYAKERRAFGAAIAQKQAIAFILADMAIEVDASRLLVWEAAWELDRGEDALASSYMAKNYIAASVMKIADNAVQVLGGHGYIREHPVELWLRNARGFATLDAASPRCESFPNIFKHQENPNMIDFEIEPSVVNRVKMFHMVAEQVMRPISREYDEKEHAEPEQFFQTMWAANAMAGSALRSGQKRKTKKTVTAARPKSNASRMRNLYTVITTEELCWGDAGLFLSTPNAGLGGAAVMAAGTPERNKKERFLKRFSRRQAEMGRDGDYGAGLPDQIHRK